MSTRNTKAFAADILPPLTENEVDKQRVLDFVSAAKAEAPPDTSVVESYIPLESTLVDWQRDGLQLLEEKSAFGYKDRRVEFEFERFFLRDQIPLPTALTYLIGALVGAAFRNLGEDPYETWEWFNELIAMLFLLPGLVLDLYPYLCVDRRVLWRSKARKYGNILYALHALCTQSFENTVGNSRCPADWDRKKDCTEILDPLLVLSFLATYSFILKLKVRWQLLFLTCTMLANVTAMIIVYDDWVTHGARQLIINILVTLAFCIQAGILGMLNFKSVQRQFESSIRLVIAQQQAVERQAVVDTLLESLVPESVLPRLVDNETSEVASLMIDNAPEASILFSDVASFTAWSSTRSAKQVVLMLNTLVTEFDSVAQKYSVERIKTIGDAYWAVSGLPQQRPDHALLLLRFAQAMLEIVKTSNAAHMEWLPGSKDGAGVQIRIGVHSGNVNGAILGEKQVAWEVFGVTNDIAALAEQNGEPGSVALTEVALICARRAIDGDVTTLPLSSPEDEAERSSEKRDKEEGKDHQDEASSGNSTSLIKVAKFKESDTYEKMISTSSSDTSSDSLKNSSSMMKLFLLSNDEEERLLSESVMKSSAVAGGGGLARLAAGGDGLMGESVGRGGKESNREQRRTKKFLQSLRSKRLNAVKKTIERSNAPADGSPKLIQEDTEESNSAALVDFGVAKFNPLGGLADSANQDDGYDADGKSTQQTLSTDGSSMHFSAWDRTAIALETRKFQVCCLGVEDEREEHNFEKYIDTEYSSMRLVSRVMACVITTVFFLSIFIDGRPIDGLAIVFFALSPLTAFICFLLTGPLGKNKYPLAELWLYVLAFFWPILGVVRATVAAREEGRGSEPISIVVHRPTIFMYAPVTGLVFTSLNGPWGATPLNAMLGIIFFIPVALVGQWMGIADNSGEILLSLFVIGNIYFYCFVNEKVRRRTFFEQKKAEHAAKEREERVAETEDVLQKLVPDHIAPALLNWISSGMSSEHSISREYNEIVIGFIFLEHVGEVVSVSAGGDYGEDTTKSWLQKAHRSIDALIDQTCPSLTKIKTVGELVMVAGPFRQQPGDNNASQRAALELMVLSHAIDTDGELNLRSFTGIHVGPVMTAVLGTIRPMFDVFGDTVNTASRVMSTSRKAFLTQGGKRPEGNSRNMVACSAQIVQMTRIGSQNEANSVFPYDLGEEEEVQAKGKGILKVYQLYKKT